MKILSKSEYKKETCRLQEEISYFLQCLRADGASVYIDDNNLAVVFGDKHYDIMRYSNFCCFEEAQIWCLMEASTEWILAEKRELPETCWWYRVFSVYKARSTRQLRNLLLAEMMAA